MNTQRKEQDLLDKRGGYTIPEFCRYFGISTPTYYKLKAQGRGPKEMRLVGAVIRISAEAASAWVCQRENPTGEEAVAVQEQEAKLKKRSDSAVAGGR